MRTLLALLLISPLLLSLSPNDTCQVRHNGIYTAPVDNETDAHIRFYPDGIVIVSTSVKNIKDVSTWFNKENSDRILKGKYKLKGCSLKFSVKGDTGSQKFTGTVQADGSLSVQITDGATKAQTSRVYTFVGI
ncbi:MAG: hypothetical protein AB1458_14300 [Bacteroidota bacterium]